MDVPDIITKLYSFGTKNVAHIIVAEWQILHKILDFNVAILTYKVDYLI